MKLTEDSPSERLVCVRDFEKAALRILDKDTGEYFRSGADDEVTLKDNSKAFLRYNFKFKLKDLKPVNFIHQIVSADGKSFHAI